MIVTDPRETIIAPIGLTANDLAVLAHHLTRSIKMLGHEIPMSEITTRHAFDTVDYRIDEGVDFIAHGFTLAVPVAHLGGPTTFRYMAYHPDARRAIEHRVDVINGNGLGWSIQEPIRADGSNFVSPRNTGLTLAGWFRQLLGQVTAVKPVPCQEWIRNAAATKATALLHQRLHLILSAETPESLWNPELHYWVTNLSPYRLDTSVADTSDCTASLLTDAGSRVATKDMPYQVSLTNSDSGRIISWTLASPGSDERKLGTQANGIELLAFMRSLDIEGPLMTIPG